MITSRDNPTYKHLKKLIADKREREQRSVYVVCGEPFLLQEAIHSGAEIETIITLDSCAVANEQRAPNATYITFSPELLRSLAPIDTSILFTVKLPQNKTPPSTEKAIILDGVSDPGNVGTIIRTAAAFGITTIIALEGTADYYNDKVIRAASGAHFHINLYRTETHSLLEMLNPVNVFIAAHEADSIAPAALRGQSGVLVIGNEARGVTPIMRNAATHTVSIPIQTDSLNAATAAAILIYEFTQL